jgi:hypothetical protein
MRAKAASGKAVVAEAYQLKCTQDSIIWAIDNEMCQRKYGIIWKGTESFAAITSRKIPKQCLMSAIWWQADSVEYQRGPEAEHTHANYLWYEQKRAERLAEKRGPAPPTPLDGHGTATPKLEPAPTTPPPGKVKEEPSASASSTLAARGRETFKTQKEEPIEPAIPIFTYIACQNCQKWQQRERAHCSLCGVELEGSTICDIANSTTKIVTCAAPQMQVIWKPRKATRSIDAQLRVKAKGMRASARRRPKGSEENTKGS